MSGADISLSTTVTAPAVYTGTQKPTSAVDALSADIYAIESVLNTISTATLVQIKSVTNSPGSVSPIGQVNVIPMVNQVNGQGQPTPHGEVSKLLYFRYQGGKNAVIIDPEVGDIGLAVFADRDISNVKATSAQANPGSGRRFHYCDGIYFGAVIAAAPQNYIAFTDSSITIAVGSTKAVFSSSGVAITATKVTNTGDIVAGQGGGDKVSLQQHIHSGVQSGGSNTGMPVAE